jgi:hypothetical protein
VTLEDAPAGAGSGGRAGGTTGGASAVGGSLGGRGGVPAGGVGVGGGVAGSNVAGSGAAPGGGGGGAGGAGAGGVAGMSTCDPLLSPRLEGTVPLVLSSRPNAAVTADWNLDGHVDLATLSVDGSVSIVLGHGDASLTFHGVYSTGLIESHPASMPDATIAAGDVNGDGTLDIVASTDVGTTVSVLTGYGDGTFSTPSLYSTGDNPVSLALADFNLDGRTDVAVASEGEDVDGSVSVLYALNDGTLSAPQQIWNDGFPYTIKAADLNDDAYPDLVVSNFAQTFVLLAGTNGTFSSHAYAGSSWWLAVGDVNGDNRQDLLSADVSDIEVDVRLGVGDGTFSAPSVSATAWAHGPLLLGDATRDGFVDVVGLPSFTLRGDGSGSFVELAGSFLTSGKVFALEDWNEDGKLDVMSIQSDAVAVHLGNGDGTFGPVRDYSSGGYPITLGSVDVDGDNQLDVISANRKSGVGSPGGSLSVLYGNGDGTLGTLVEYLTGDVVGLATPDLNGDQYPDFVSLDANAEHVSVQLGPGSGVNAAMQEYELADNADAYGVGVQSGDLNRDSQPDVVAVTDIALHIFLGQGDGTLAAPVIYDLDMPAVDHALLDIDGDGRLDVALLNAIEMRLDVHLGEGDGNFRRGRETVIGAFSRSFAFGDLNGDSRVDALVGSDSSLSVYLGVGDGSFERLEEHAIQVTDIAIVDFDQDGRRDFLVSGTGLTVFLGAGDGRVSCVLEYVRGSTTERLAIADLDADGTPDVLTSGRTGAISVLSNPPR